MIDFLKYRHICLIGSAILLLSGAVAYVINFQKNGSGFEYHIDFVGGTELNITFEEPIKTSDFRSAMNSKGWKDLTIQSIGFAATGSKYKEFIVRVKETSDNIENKFKADMNDSITSIKSDIRGVSRVGSEVGKDIRWNSFLSVILSLLVILLYIAIRSRYRFALGAVAAIVHDILVVLVVFLLLREQISVSVLAAILAVIGYSLNDTIVIFGRVRENMVKLKDHPEHDIVNISLNQTFRRTLLTSLSTLLTVLSVLILGGGTLRGFSIVMLVGVLAGTYSSIYIASPIMLAIKSAQNK